MTIYELNRTACDIRLSILDIVTHAGAGHIGGDFSMADILTTLYFQVLSVSPEMAKDPNRDRFVLSKGHAVEAYYAVLAARGFFPKEDLKKISRYNSPYIGHPTNKINGIEACSGSLGHGLSLATGMALAARMDNKSYRTYTILGDGELAEGSVWEGAMAAGHYQLDTLTAVVDRNHLQISGATEDVLSITDLPAVWKGFGWHVIPVNGNDIAALVDAFTAAQNYKGKPTVLLADTIKGAGVSFMEGQAGWHHRVPTTEEYQLAKTELLARRKLYE